MAPSSRERALIGALFVLVVLFIVSLPGLGVETRTTAQYAAWAGPIFLVLTILVFALSLAGIGLARYGRRSVAATAGGAATAAVAIVLFDLSAIGGPPDPPGPLALSVVVLVVCALIYYLALRSQPIAPASSE